MSGRGLIGGIGANTEPFAYLDDVVVASRTFNDHLDHQRKIVARLQEANLRVNVEKPSKKSDT